MAGHHLILGELKDFITGRMLADTLDERCRQQIARLLVEQKGYRKQDIETRRPLVVQADDRKARVNIDFVVHAAGMAAMIIRFAPGSIVTRRRPALATSRLVAPYQVPVAVATNGRDAEVIDGFTGEVFGRGLEAIPSRPRLEQAAAAGGRRAISGRRAQLEARIFYCYEVDGSCPCDEDICRLEP